MKIIMIVLFLYKFIQSSFQLCPFLQINPMQLSKLQKNSQKIIKNRIRLKSLSFGLNPSIKPLSQMQKIQKLINRDSCIHQNNTQQVLLTQFTNQIPQTQNSHQIINEFYRSFVNRVLIRLQQSKQKQKTEPNDNEQNSVQTDNLSYNKDDVDKINRQIHKILQNQPRKYTILLSNCIKQVYDEAERIQEVTRFKVSKIQKDIEKLYIQSHEKYGKVMQIKASRDDIVRIIQQEAEIQTSKDNDQEYDQQKFKKQSNLHKTIKLQKNTQYNRLAHEFQKISNKIHILKNNILKKEEEQRKLAQREKQITADKTQFLKILLRNGYSQSDGIWSILAELAHNNDSIGEYDLNGIIDSMTKKHVIEEYELLRREIKKKYKKLPKMVQNTQTSKFAKPQSISMSKFNYTQMMNIPGQGNGSKIYKEAQGYIVDWVRKQRWKIRSLKHKDNSNNIEILGEGWMEKEIQRLNMKYPKEIYHKMLIYLFGTLQPIKETRSLAYYTNKETKKDRKISQSISGMLTPIPLLSRNTTMK